MLRIREEQMKILDANMMERFIEKMTAHLRSVFPEKTDEKDNQELRDWIEKGIEKAATFEITEEREVALFIDLMTGMGAGFEKQKPWIEKILLKETLNQQEKMDIICKRLQG